MSWVDRIIEAAYTSPSGVRTIFNYENVSKSVDKKTTAFDFPDADGTYIQDLGHTGRRYPLRIIFWGDDYDIQSAAFESSLLERGIGKLEHPVYGSSDVVPFGPIKQRDDLKTAANQAIIEVTFFETIGLIYPSSTLDPTSDILQSIDEYNIATSQEFEDVTSLGTTIEKSKFLNTYNAFLNSAKSGLQTVADVQADVQKEFDTIENSINNGIDVLISTPLTLAFQTILLIQSPARALTNIKARLDAYENLADSIISGNGAGGSDPATPSVDSSNSNDYHTKDLYASTYVTGSVVSVVNNKFVTKTEALEAAENVIEQFEAVAQWRDDNFKSLGEIDKGDSYQKLQQAVALTAGFLVDVSFTLKQERRLVLNRDRNIIELVAFLYGDVDDQLDFFITSNDLSGSEILELPKGREIVYYI
ncbi:MAG: DNA circularization N-terminal domain-containing protein [Proteobacteria bacterium]|nr:DNA circularization N-terminal domain-containing protein [Pseudomonadota bacterium]